MRVMEDLKEMLEDELKKITKKGDITPQELENAYKVVDILKDLQTIKAMKEYDEESGGQSQRGGRMGNSYNSYAPVWNQDMMPYSMENSRESNYSNRGSYDGSYEGHSSAGRRGRDGDGDGHYSEEGSYRRGRDARTGRYVSRDMSRDGSYDRSYDTDYSRHTEKEKMISKLEDMMEDTSSEKIKRAIGQCLDKLER